LQDALLVNPFSTEDLTEAMVRALNMPLAERRQRNAAMRAVVESETVSWWRDRFVSDLAAISDGRRT
jgi:trehalose 6-phosphate synthase